MFFAPFDEIDRTQNQNFSTFNNKLTFVFKSLFLISLGFLMYNLVTSNGLYFANIPSVTFLYNEYWRIFTAPFATLDGFYGLVSIVIGFWWLASLFPGYERKYSSIHLLFQVFIQNLIVQVSYSLVVAILVRNTYFYQNYNDYFFSLGWTPMVIVWIFKFTSECKEEKVNFCFLPFLVKNKYLAWIISVLVILLTIQKTPLIVATVVGAIQFHLFGRSAIRLPIVVYKVFQKPFLLFSGCCTSFVKVDDAIHNLERLNGIKKQGDYALEFSQNELEEDKNKSQLISDLEIKTQKKQSEIQMRQMEKIITEPEESM